VGDRSGRREVSGSTATQDQLPDWVAGVEATADLGLLALGEMFHAVPEQPADLIHRVVLVAAAAQGVLLHARRTSSTTWVPSRTTWNASSTATASERPS